VIDIDSFLLLWMGAGCLPSVMTLIVLCFSVLDYIVGSEVVVLFSSQSLTKYPLIAKQPELVFY
jgi:hypothetical protein